MKLENTDFTREHTDAEEKAQGLNDVHNTDDIWKRKRGNDDQLAKLFVAMARAAGLKAYLAAVTDRDRNIFLTGYLSLSQFDDYIAIVNVDGKEQFFDPGARYCPYSISPGSTLRPAPSPDRRRHRFVDTPGEGYTYSRPSDCATSPSTSRALSPAPSRCPTPALLPSAGDNARSPAMPQAWNGYPYQCRRACPFRS